MAEIKASINGAQVIGQEGQTILEVSREHGIEIPTLCYLADVSPTGSCRICVVEVEGSRTLVGSCHTPLAPGMVIRTDSPKVVATRKVLMELLFASHCGFCMICDKANICNLREMAAEMDVGLTRFQTRKRFYPIEDNPYIQIDRSKCILCRKCVRACREIARTGVLGVAYRGFYTKIVIDNDRSLAPDACQNCDICISVCPTGSLTKPRKLSEPKAGKALFVSQD